MICEWLMPSKLGRLTADRYPNQLLESRKIPCTGFVLFNPGYERASVQAEFAVDCVDLRRLDQPRVRYSD
jgi:hypothetical protein